MITLLIVFHLLFSIGLIIAVLLHSGRGAGLSTAISGSSSFLGKTMMEKYLDRITIALAIGFVSTTVLLVFFWSQ